MPHRIGTAGCRPGVVGLGLANAAAHVPDMAADDPTPASVPAPAPVNFRALRAIADAATPGPWYWHPYATSGATLASPGPALGSIGGFPVRGHELNVLKTTDDWPPASADAEFIAAARTHLPALLDLLSAQAVRIEQLNDEVSELTGGLETNEESYQDLSAQADQHRALVADLRDRVLAGLTDGATCQWSLLASVLTQHGFDPAAPSRNAASDHVLSGYGQSRMEGWVCTMSGCGWQGDPAWNNARARTEHDKAVTAPVPRATGVRS